jgi:LssY C-terminus
MVPFFILVLRRLGIFIVVVALAYFTAFELFPFLDKRIPALWAALITYSLMAYIGIPSAIRILRFIYKPNHVPTYTATSDGWASDPVNIAVLARSERNFIWAMRKAGWQVADKNSLSNVIHEGYALLFDQPYPTAPFSKLYLFGRKQDLGFQIPVGNSPRHRHHVRFWRVDIRNNQKDTKAAREHQGFWRTLLKRFLRRKYSLWVGAAIYDSGPVAIRWRTGQITHQIHPDANFERDFIIESLQKAHVLRNVADIQAGEPYRGRGQAIGVTVISDGFVKLCEVKRQVIPPTVAAVELSERLAVKG